MEEEKIRSFRRALITLNNFAILSPGCRWNLS